MSGPVQNADIVAEMKRRKISQLLHFTPMENLVQMMNYGCILPREALEKEDFTANDAVRLDGSDHINLSVQQCNSRLFYVFRRRAGALSASAGQQQPSWAMISIRPEALTLGKCCFTATNAASHAAVRLTGTDGFRKLFAGSDDMIPADSQAECLFFAPIPLDYWQAVYVKDHEMQAQVYCLMSVMGVPRSAFEVVVNPGFFR